MKKIYLISVITIIIGIIFSVRPHWLKVLWGVQILLLPLIAGILMVLAQKENRSYRFMKKLVAGSALIGFGYVFLLQIIEYFRYGQYYDKSFFSLANIINIIPFSLFLAGVCIFGGLIGIVVRGIIILLSKK